jgi:3-hydroxyisobutyrate dehydrogenase
MSEAERPKTAVVGLGQMGRGIARNLDRSGLLTVAFDLTEGAFAQAGLSGGVQNLSGQNVIDCVDILLCAVPSTTEIDAALRGCVASRNPLVIDLTTSDPMRSRALAKDLARRGFRYLDAAMTGGAAGADAGALTLMVGADPEDVAQATPVFDVIADQVFHLGPIGAGHAMKLVHNMILHSSFMATCEGLRLADRAGLDLHTAVAVLNAGNARSFVTEVRFPRDILSGTMNARSVVGNLEKDLGLAVGFARAHDALVPYGAMTHSLLEMALADGHAKTDFSHLFPLYEGLASKAERDR